MYCKKILKTLQYKKQKNFNETRKHYLKRNIFAFLWKKYFCSCFILFVIWKKYFMYSNYISLFCFFLSYRNYIVVNFKKAIFNLFVKSFTGFKNIQILFTCLLCVYVGWIVYLWCWVYYYLIKLQSKILIIILICEYFSALFDKHLEVKKKYIKKCLKCIF